MNIKIFFNKMADIQRSPVNDKKAVFLCIADTHGRLCYDRVCFLSELKSKEPIDAIITLGDVRKDELDIIIEHAGEIPIYGIKGNHDDEDQFDGRKITDINGNMSYVNGVSIIGIEGNLKYKPTAIGYTQEDSLEFVKSFPKRADILFSHSHAWRDEDNLLGQYNVHIGLIGTRHYMNQNYCVNIHGHDHTSTEMINSKETRVYGIQRITYCNGKLLLSENEKFDN